MGAGLDVRGARAALTVTAVGLLTEGLVLAYILRTDAGRPPLALVAAVLVPILLVSFGTMFGTAENDAGDRKTGRPLRGLRPVLVAALVLVSVLGPVRLTQVLMAAERPPASPSPTDVRAEFVLMAVRERGVGPALALLRQQVELDPQLLVQSHHVAHEAGRIAVEEAGFDPSVLSQCTLDFASGCVHGVLERYFYAHPSIDDDAIGHFCADLLGRSDLDAEALECAHGLGHGFAVRWNHDAKRATEDCDRLASQVERRECADGVFMEVTTFALGAGHPGAHMHSAMEPHDAIEPHDAQAMNDSGCHAVVDRYAASCWAYRYLTLRAASGGSWAQTAEGCLAAEAPELVDACVTGIGKQVALEHFGDWPTVYRICEALPTSASQGCVAGAVEHVIDFDWSSDRAFGFCAGAPADLASSCYQRLGTRVEFLDGALETADPCAPAPTELREACRRGVEGTRALLAAR